MSVKEISLGRVTVTNSSGRCDNIYSTQTNIYMYSFYEKLKKNWFPSTLKHESAENK